MFARAKSPEKDVFENMIRLEPRGRFRSLQTDVRRTYTCCEPNGDLKDENHRYKRPMGANEQKIDVARVPNKMAGKNGGSATHLQKKVNSATTKIKADRFVAICSTHRFLAKLIFVLIIIIMLSESEDAGPSRKRQKTTIKKATTRRELAAKIARATRSRRLAGSSLAAAVALTMISALKMPWTERRYETPIVDTLAIPSSAQYRACMTTARSEATKAAAATRLARVVARRSPPPPSGRRRRHRRRPAAVHRRQRTFSRSLLATAPDDGGSGARHR